MPQRPVDDVAQHARVEHHDRPGNGRHAAGHDRKQFGTGQLGEIGADDQGRFRHAKEQARRRSGADRAANAQGAPQHRPEGPYDRRQDAPVPQDGNQRAEHQNLRQDPEGEQVQGAFDIDFKGRRATAEIAKHEAGAGLGGLLDSANQAVDGQQHLAQHGSLKQQCSEGELHGQCGDQHPPIQFPAVLAH